MTKSEAFKKINELFKDPVSGRHPAIGAKIFALIEYANDRGYKFSPRKSKMTIFFKFKQKCKFRIRTHNLDLCNHDHIKDCDCEYFNCPFIHAAHGEKINQRIDDPRIDWEAYNDPREED